MRPGFDAHAVEDVVRLLATTWRPWGRTPLARDLLVRQWSLDHKWMDATAAAAAVDALQAAGWLEWSAEGVRPALDVRRVVGPIGWGPIPKRLLEVPPLQEVLGTEALAATGATAHATPPATGTVPTAAPRSTPSTAGPDGADGPATRASIPSPPPPAAPVPGSSTAPALTAAPPSPSPGAELSGLLLRRLAAASGLEPKEVNRRAVRKRRALVPLAPWFALVLVGHEQGVDLSELLAGTPLAAHLTA